MSLYNMIFGANPAGPTILATLGITVGDTGRYRDCYVEKTDDGAYRIVLHTRNGGGNRDDYQDVLDALAMHPLHQGDEDDEFDCTYANIFFGLPTEYEAELRAIADQQQFVAPSEKWRQLLAAMSAPDGAA